MILLLNNFYIFVSILYKNCFFLHRLMRQTVIIRDYYGHILTTTQFVFEPIIRVTMIQDSVASKWNGHMTHKNKHKIIHFFTDLWHFDDKIILIIAWTINGVVQSYWAWMAAVGSKAACITRCLHSVRFNLLTCTCT